MKLAGENVQATQKTEYLRYDFNDAEIADAARDLATANRKRSSLEQRKKEVDSAIKAEIEEQNSIIGRLSQLIGTGFEYRDVDVRVCLDTPESGKKTIYRIDTGEEVAVNLMTESEKQMSLDLQTAAEAAEEEARAKEEADKVIVTPPPELKKLGDGTTATLSILQPDGTYAPIAEITDAEGVALGVKMNSDMAQQMISDAIDLHSGLASAVQMGGTHQKKKRGKEAAAGDPQ